MSVTESTIKRDEAPIQREGSPWTGVWAVVMKEMADHLSSVRMRLLEGLILLTALGTVYAAIQNLRQTVGQDPFLFLRLFTTPIEQTPWLLPGIDLEGFCREVEAAGSTPIVLPFFGVFGMQAAAQAVSAAG